MSLDSENIYSKVLCFRLKEELCSNHTGSIKLILSLQWQVSSSQHAQQLVICLTDDSDPLFLYILRLTEVDFQNVKQQQGVLVDFPAFPQSLTNLLELCLKHENNSNPMYLLTISFNQNPPHCAKTAEIEIVETNSFKRITQLFLKLSAPDDIEAKQYLSVCFQKLKQDKQKIESRLSFVENDLKNQLQSYREAITSKTQELESLRNDLNTEISVKSNKCIEDLQREKEELLKLSKEDKEKWEKEKKEKDQTHRKEIKSLEMKTSHLEQANKKLSEKTRALESNCEELKSRVESLKDDSRRMNDQLAKVRKEGDILQIQLEEKDVTLNKMQRELVNLQQEIATKLQHISWLENENEDVKKKLKSLENLSAQRKTQLEKCQKKQRQLADDISHANDIIKKFQDEAQSFHEKLQIRGKLVKKQEEVIAEKEDKIKKLEEQLSAFKSQTKDQTAESEVLKDTVAMLESKVKEYDVEARKKDYTIRELSQRVGGLNISNKTSNTRQNQSSSRLNRHVDGVGRGYNQRSSPSQYVYSSNGIQDQVLRPISSNQPLDGQHANMFQQCEDAANEDDSLICTVYGNSKSTSAAPVRVVNHQQITNPKAKAPGLKKQANYNKR